MSQYHFSVNSNVGQVIVSIGWDSPLQHFFMSIYSDDETQPIYDNMFESNPFQLSLSHYQSVLNIFSITEIALCSESKLYKQLMNDKLFS